MSISFVTRGPSQDEVEQLRLAMSSFRDGSGQEKDQEGGTRPGWRDLERVIAEILGGVAPESKSVFDVFIPSTEQQDTDYGLSVKSK